MAHTRLPARTMHACRRVHELDTLYTLHILPTRLTALHTALHTIAHDTRCRFWTSPLQSICGTDPPSRRPSCTSEGPCNMCNMMYDIWCLPRVSLPMYDVRSVAMCSVISTAVYVSPVAWTVVKGGKYGVSGCLSMLSFVSQRSIAQRRVYG